MVPEGVCAGGTLGDSESRPYVAVPVAGASVPEGVCAGGGSVVPYSGVYAVGARASISVTTSTTTGRSAVSA